MIYKPKKNEINSADTISRTQWIQLILVGSGMFLSALDISVNVALPNISEFFTVSPNITYFMIIFYLGTTVALQLPMGSAGDAFGLKNVFIFGLIVYTIAMVSIGLSPTINTVLGFRILQAFGNSAILSIAPALATSLFPSSYRGRALGIMAGIGSLGMIFGTVFAGVILEFLPWQWIFLGRIPICVLCIIGSLIVIKTYNTSNLQKTHRTTDFDWIGAILIFIGIISAVLFLNLGTNIGWIQIPTLSTSVISIGSIILFIRRQISLNNPLIEFTLINNPIVLGGFFANLFLYMGSFVNLFILPFFVAEIISASSIILGIFLLLNAISISLCSPIGGYFSDKYGSGITSVAGLCIVSLGLLSYSILSPESSLVEIGIRMIIVGSGIGLFQSANLSLIMGNMSSNSLGTGGAISAISRAFGSVTAVTLIGWFFTFLYQSNSPDVDLIYASSTRDSIESFMYAFQISYILGSILMILGVISSLIAWIGLKKTQININ